MNANKLGTLNSNNGELIHVFPNNIESTADFHLYHIVSSDRVIGVNELVGCAKQWSWPLPVRTWKTAPISYLPANLFPPHHDYYNTMNTT
jgi:hypothetical protein